MTLKEEEPGRNLGNKEQEGWARVKDYNIPLVDDRGGREEEGNEGENNRTLNLFSRDKIKEVHRSGITQLMKITKYKF